MFVPKRVEQQRLECLEQIEMRNIFALASIFPLTGNRVIESRRISVDKGRCSHIEALGRRNVLTVGFQWSQRGRETQLILFICRFTFTILPTC